MLLYFLNMYQCLQNRNEMFCNIFNYWYAPNFVRIAGEYHTTTMFKMAGPFPCM